jgi:SPP1 family predicted phage head-tail adaptor
MNPGILRHSITIQQKDGTRGAAGGEKNTWAEVVTRRAQVLPLQGRELATQRQTYAEATHRVFMRYVDGITPKMRVQWTDPVAQTSRYFDIASVLNMDGQKRYMELIAVERNV